MARIYSLLFFFLWCSTLSAQFLGAGYVRAHQNDELRITFGNKNGHHEWQAFIEIFLNPQGEARKGAFFEGRRFAFDSLDRVGAGGRYAYHWFSENKRFMPYVGFETQLAPTGMRLSLQQSDGTYQDVFFRRTLFWDNYGLAGCRISLGKRFSLDINGGLGLVRIFGIPRQFTIQTSSGIHLDSAGYFGAGIKYYPRAGRWR